MSIGLSDDEIMAMADAIKKLRSISGAKPCKPKSVWLCGSDDFPITIETAPEILEQYQDAIETAQREAIDATLVHYRAIASGKDA